MMNGDEVRKVAHEWYHEFGEKAGRKKVIDILAELADEAAKREEVVATKFQFFDDWANAASKRIEALERTACIKGVDHD